MPLSDWNRKSHDNLGNLSTQRSLRSPCTGALRDESLRVPCNWASKSAIAERLPKQRNQRDRTGQLYHVSKPSKMARTMTSRTVCLGSQRQEVPYSSFRRANPWSWTSFLMHETFSKLVKHLRWCTFELNKFYKFLHAVRKASGKNTPMPFFALLYYYFW